jgi:hypothetical protein
MSINKRVDIIDNYDIFELEVTYLFVITAMEGGVLTPLLLSPIKLI